MTPNLAVNESRHWLTLLLVVLAAAHGCSPAPDLETARLFQDAEDAFAAADSPDGFVQVASRYDQLLSSGFVSGAVLYNQGNAWMRAGQTGRAIASWRQSQRYRPRDAFLRANLGDALQKCQSTAPVRPALGVAGYVFFWQDWLSYREKFLLATALLTVVCALSLIQTSWISKTLRRRLLVGVGLLFMISALSATWDWQRFEQTIHGVVIEDSTDARKGNSDSYEAAFTESLHEGQEFRVVETRADWLQIEVPGLGSGWIPQRSAVTY